MDARRAQQLLTWGTWTLAVLLAPALSWHVPDGTAVTALVLGLALAAASGLVDGALHLGRFRFSVRGGDLVLGAGLLLCPTGWWAVALVVGTAVGLLPGRLPRAAVLRATGETALRAAAALSALRLLTTVLPGGGLVLAVLGAALFAAAVGHLASAVGVAATVRQSVLAVLRHRGLVAPAQTAVTVALAGAAGAAIRAAPAAVVPVTVSVVLLALLRSAQRRHSADLQMYAELVRGQEQAAGRSVDVSAEVVLGTAARLLGGADCELLVRHPAGPVRFTGDEYGVRDRVQVGAGEFDRPWAMRTLSSPLAHSGTETGRPFVAAPVGRDTPWALLVARRPAGAPAFGRVDRRRLAALTEQAQTWLAVSELTGWDSPYDTGLPAGLSASAEPALRTLRDASRRLSRLAQQWDSGDPVSDVATEMYACQTAVAELMGAVMGRAVTVPGRSPGLVRPVEWTSTGALADWGEQP